MRVLLTECCNADCRNCFNAAVRGQDEIPAGVFVSLCEYLRKNNVSSLKIMGGEPTVHTEFETCMAAAQKSFPSVILFTNAVNDKILQVQIRARDCITYNFRFMNEEFDLRKLRFDQPGYRAIEVQIASDTDTAILAGQIERFAAEAEMRSRSGQIRFNLTLDCTENIFEKADILREKWNRIADHITNTLSLVFDIDHKIPKCVASQLHMADSGSLCDKDCAGLIDARLNLRFCNQYADILMHIRDKNGWTDFKKIETALQQACDRKNRSCACAGCINYLTVCNGGCFGHKFKYRPGIRRL